MGLVADLCTKLVLMPCLDSFSEVRILLSNCKRCIAIFFLINGKMCNVVSSSLAFYLEENGKLD